MLPVILQCRVPSSGKRRVLALASGMLMVLVDGPFDVDPICLWKCVSRLLAHCALTLGISHTQSHLIDCR